MRTSRRGRVRMREQDEEEEQDVGSRYRASRKRLVVYMDSLEEAERLRSVGVMLAEGSRLGSSQAGNLGRAKRCLSLVPLPSVIQPTKMDNADANEYCTWHSKESSSYILSNASSTR